MTRPQLEAKIKALEKENAWLRKHSTTIVASDGVFAVLCNALHI